MRASSQMSSNCPAAVDGTELVGLHQLPDQFKPIFPHCPPFNAVQSKCFNTIYNSNDNFVLSAPTGSGKTAVLELAICRLFSQSQGEEFKVVYQAPTKSLCAERQKDWQTKFSRLGLKCAELTGDTEQSQLRYVQTADILVTTPEKWDSMTRKWKDHRKLMELVKLFLIDEVHILKDDRGACLEAIVSRMKSVGSDIRYVALSATVPNSEDIATWLGRNTRIPGMPAAREVFGEEFRPVQLRKHVYGIQANSKNDFAFDQTCNKHLPDIITKYSTKSKPIMVFCMTRKSTEVTAKLLAEWWTSRRPQERLWTSPSKPQSIRDERLRECVKTGVAFHHAGLDQTDRVTIEQGYLTSEINVICCTSTLAVGVNLPCYFVVIKNTVVYQTEGCKEYSDIEVMQMLGRAGRPQFDDDAVAVIMTRHEKVDGYKTMVSGQEILESKLHLNLIEHLNAEIGLGTISDLSSAKTWLKGTFLFVRFRRNPDHYRLSNGMSTTNVEKIVNHTCTENLDQLRQFSLIDDSLKIKSTEFGDAMARYYVQFETMKLFMGLQSKAKISEILSAIAQASEFKSIRFRSGEKQMFKEINASPSIKFPIKVDLALGPHKISLIIQATLGGLDMRTDDRFSNHTQQFIAETSIVFQHVHRLIRCIIDCQIHLGDSVAARNALELSRGFGARAWDDSPLQMQQIDRVGPVAVRKFISAGIRTIEELEATESQRIDMILSRNPPFGCNLLRDLQGFPKLWVSLKMHGKPIAFPSSANSGVRIEVEVELGFLNESPPVLFRKKPVHVVLLSETSDGHLVHFCRISGLKLGKGQSVRFGVDLLNSQQLVNCYASCDDIAGTQKYVTLNPIIPVSAFNAGIWTKEPQRIPEKRQINKSLRPMSTSSNSDDFGINDLNDLDLVAAAHTDFEDIDAVECSSTKTPSARHMGVSKTATVQSSFDIWHPTVLANGNWACNHHCKDKTICKHLCCREGLEKPPKRPKDTKAQASNRENIENSMQTGPMNDFFARKAQVSENMGPGRLKTPSNSSKRRISPPNDPNNDEVHYSSVKVQKRKLGIPSDDHEPRSSSFRDNSVSFDHHRRPIQSYSNRPGVFTTHSSSPNMSSSNALEIFDLTDAPDGFGKTGFQGLSSDISMREPKKQRTEKSQATETHEKPNESNVLPNRERTARFPILHDLHEAEVEDESEFDPGINLDDAHFPVAFETSAYTASHSSADGERSIRAVGTPIEPSTNSPDCLPKMAPYGYGPIHNIPDTVNPKDTVRSFESLPRIMESQSSGAQFQGIDLVNASMEEAAFQGSERVQRQKGINLTMMRESVLATKPTLLAVSDSRSGSFTELAYNLAEKKKEKKDEMKGIDNWLLEQFGDIVEFV